jgi:hypothetical protein
MLVETPAGSHADTAHAEPPHDPQLCLLIPSSPVAFLAQVHNVRVSVLPVAGRTTKRVRLLPSSKGALDNGLAAPTDRTNATRPRAGSDIRNLQEPGDPLRARRPQRTQGRASQCT